MNLDISYQLEGSSLKIEKRHSDNQKLLEIARLSGQSTSQIINSFREKRVMQGSVYLVQKGTNFADPSVGSVLSYSYDILNLARHAIYLGTEEVLFFEELDAQTIIKRNDDNVVLRLETSLSHMETTLPIWFLLEKLHNFYLSVLQDFSNLVSGSDYESFYTENVPFLAALLE